MDAISAGAVAVIFVSRRTAADPDGYLGIDSTRDGQGFGITVSYWRDAAAAAAWRDDPRHSEIRDQGRARWYASYTMTVATVARRYGWSLPVDR